MNTQLNPYVSFKDNAREAMEFYKSVFGGELTLSTFGEYPMPDLAEEEKNKIMHAALKAPNGIVFFGSDTPNRMTFEESTRVSMSLSGENEEELRGYFEKLSENGTITMPLEKAPWGDTFGMCKDQFGISWMVNVTNKKEA